MAIAWQRQGQQDKARESLNEALKAKPDYAPALLELARTSALSGDIEAALVGLDKVPRQSSAGAEARKLRGDLLLYSKRDMARLLFRHVLKASGKCIISPLFGANQRIEQAK